MPAPVLVPVLGDQLSPELASLARADPADTIVLMMEVWEEATYVRHHKQKIALIFSAMRHFAAELREAGWQVDYVMLDDPDNASSFTGEVARAIERHSPRLVSVVGSVGASSFPSRTFVLISIADTADTTSSLFRSASSV